MVLLVQERDRAGAWRPLRTADAAAADGPSLLSLAASHPALVAAAEANVIPLARRRLRGVSTPGLTSLLRTYVRERQRMLRRQCMKSTSLPPCCRTQ